MRVMRGSRVAGPCQSAACQVPVFRYFLERREPAAWKVPGFSSRPSFTAAADPCRKARRAVDRNPSAWRNIDIEAVDLAKCEPALKAFYDRLPPAELPRLVLLPPFRSMCWPKANRCRRPSRSGRSGCERTASRNCSIHRCGESSLGGCFKATLPCGSFWNAATRPKTGLPPNCSKRSSRKRRRISPLRLTMPTLPPRRVRRKVWIRSQASPRVPLRVAFSVLRVSRHAGEDVLVRMLMATEAELPKSNRPADGLSCFWPRRRSLGGTGGKGNRAGTDPVALCGFLVGECSCAVRAEMPGMDLLMAVDWAGLLEGRVVIDKVLPPLTGVMPAALQPGGTDKRAGRRCPRRSWSPRHPAAAYAAGLITVAAVLAAMGIGTFFVWRRSGEA